LHQGDRRPECQRGKVYPLHNPGPLVRIKGQAPIAATVYELQKLRCNLCGEVFTAEAPEGMGEEKYDATVASMMALLRYGSGFPWCRLEEHCYADEVGSGTSQRAKQARCGGCLETGKQGGDRASTPYRTHLGAPHTEKGLVHE
jgi:hypothetical protein